MLNLGFLFQSERKNPIPPTNDRQIQWHKVAYGLNTMNDSGHLIK